MMMSSAITSWVLDLAILIEPLVVVGRDHTVLIWGLPLIYSPFKIRKLNMSTKRKLQASVVFLFSFL